MRLAVLALLLLFVARGVCAQSERQDPHDSSQWENDIAKFEQADELKPPLANAILFVGSSSIRLWNLQKSFPELITINRGFGGSQLADSVQFIDRIVLKYNPRAVVLYAGDNDINAGKTPERIFADFTEFVAILHKHLPDTTLHYIAIKPSISRWKLVEMSRLTNQFISSYCDLDEKLFFVDIDRALLRENGEPNPELFIEDGLHMSEAGYRIWTEKLGESLKQPGGVTPTISSKESGS